MKIRAMLLTSVAASALAARFTPFGVDAVDPLEKLDTVEINTPNGPLRINATDYDPEKHELTNPEAAEAVLSPAPSTDADPQFAAPASPPVSGTDTPPAPGAASPTTPPPGSAGLPPAATAQAPATAPAAPAGATETTGPVITKIGSGKAARQFVTDANGNKLDGYAAEGYETVEAAQDAITAARAQQPAT